MLKFISSIFIFGLSVTLNAQTVKPIYVVHVQLGNSEMADAIKEELLKTNPNFKNRPVIVLHPDLELEDNPFAASKWGRQAGQSRPGNEIAYDQIPILSEKAEKWFEDLEQKDIHPEVFIINGHHLVGMGFTSDDAWETPYQSNTGDTIYLAKESVHFPSIILSRDRYPAVKRFFDSVKMVFIGGCEGLANLEPKEFGLYGRALAPEEIKARYFGNQKNLMLGSVAEGTGLAGYKADLVRVYHTFVEKQEDEVCLDPVLHLNCEILNVNRIWPDSGLWDGYHTYNIPYQMKRAFPNAYGVFGFATPSPLFPGYLWKATFNKTRADLKMNNFFQPLLSDSYSQAEKKIILQKLRVSWTKATLDLNTHERKGKRIIRVSGSITPAFPDLDKNGIYAYENGFAGYKEAPAFAPYELRDEKKEESAIVEIRPTVTENAPAPIQEKIEIVKIAKEDVSKLLMKQDIKVVAPTAAVSPVTAAPINVAPKPILASTQVKSQVAAQVPAVILPSAKEGSPQSPPRKHALFLSPDEFKKVQQQNSSTQK